MDSNAVRNGPEAENTDGNGRSQTLDELEDLLEISGDPAGLRLALSPSTQAAIAEMLGLIRSKIDNDTVIARASLDAQSAAGQATVGTLVVTVALALVVVIPRVRADLCRETLPRRGVLPVRRHRGGGVHVHAGALSPVQLEGLAGP